MRGKSVTTLLVLTENSIQVYIDYCRIDEVYLGIGRSEQSAGSFRRWITLVDRLSELNSLARLTVLATMSRVILVLVPCRSGLEVQTILAELAARSH